MALALRVFGSAIRQVGGHLTVSTLATVTAVLLSLPLLLALGLVAHAFSLALFPLGAAVLLGVLPNPVCAAVQVAAGDLARGEVPAWRDLRRATGSYWRPTLLAWFLGAAVTSVIVLNVIFYARAGAGSAIHVLAGPLEVVWDTVLILWLALHLYVYPLLLRQERPSIMLAYRNAAVLTLTAPVFTLTLTVLWLAWLLLGATLGPVYLFGLALAASMQQGALLRLLPRFNLNPATD